MFVCSISLAYCLLLLSFWLSQVWWVKCILRYIPPSEGVEGTTETQRTQRSIDLGLCPLAITERKIVRVISVVQLPEEFDVDDKE